jgi:hypothetical protein
MDNKAISLDENGVINNVIVGGSNIPDGYQVVAVNARIGKSVSECEAIDNAQSTIKFKSLFLANTDWIVVKISEAFAAGEDITVLNDKYADVIAFRKAARKSIGVARTVLDDLV